MVFSLIIAALLLDRVAFIPGHPPNRQLSRSKIAMSSVACASGSGCSPSGFTEDAIDSSRPTLAVSQFAVCGVNEIVVWSQTVRGGYGIVEPGAHPWLVAIFNGDHEFTCIGILLFTGSYIASDMILGLSGCTSGNFYDAVVVADLGRVEKTLPKVAKWIPFKRDGVPTRNNDLVVFRVEGGIQFGSTVKPVCLPGGGYNIPDNGHGVAAGLKMYEHVTLKRETPWRLWEAAVTFSRSTQSSLTVRHQVKEPRGDIIGSPLIFKKDGKYFLKGVANSNHEHVEISEVDTYTAIEPYLDWIRGIINEYSKCKA